MAQTAKKAAVIGFDCALPNLVEKHIAEGKLPNFKKAIEGGVFAENCLVPYPTITPPNWASIATGAWPGTHGITDFHMPEPGATPDNSSIKQAFSSARYRAETVWDALDKAGTKCIVLNYPGSWPSKMKNGIMVAGAGLSPGESRDGITGLNSHMMLCHDQLVTTGAYPMAIRGKFQAAEEWANATEMGDDPLELAFTLTFPGAHPKPPKTTWYVLARQSEDDGYDTITLSPSKKLSEAFCTLKVGEWSAKITTKIDMGDGTATEVFFRTKLIELSDDAEDFRLFIGALCAVEGWSNPPEIARELVSEEGTFVPGGGIPGYTTGWFDVDTYCDLTDQHSKWLGDAATTLLKNHEWDAFFMHSHPPDWLYHMVLTDMDPVTQPDEAKRKQAWETHLKVYESQDRMLGQIMEAAGKDTLVIIVTDHGATPDGPMFDPYYALVPAGLAVLAEEQPELRAVGYAAKAMKRNSTRPDPNSSRAFGQRSCHIFVNLKGRDPEGIVEPADYEKVQQEIIDALYAYVDAKTGRRPVCLALAKKDARLLGLHGDNVGDVIYAVYPWFGSQHGQILPTGEWGVGTLKGMLIFNGPGIKKGYRLPRTCGITDVVPTLCYALDLPVPEQCEGNIIYQAFKDPNFKQKEIQKLRDGLARMETALARQEREPWDKHDCA